MAGLWPAMVSTVPEVTSRPCAALTEMPMLKKPVRGDGSADDFGRPGRRDRDNSGRKAFLRRDRARRDRRVGAGFRAGTGAVQPGGRDRVHDDIDLVAVGRNSMTARTGGRDVVRGDRNISLRAGRLDAGAGGAGGRDIARRHRHVADAIGIDAIGQTAGRRDRAGAGDGDAGLAVDEEARALISRRSR